MIQDEPGEVSPCCPLFLFSENVHSVAVRNSAGSLPYYGTANQGATWECGDVRKLGLPYLCHSVTSGGLSLSVARSATAFVVLLASVPPLLSG